MLTQISVHEQPARTLFQKGDKVIGVDPRLTTVSLISF